MMSVRTDTLPPYPGPPTSENADGVADSTSFSGATDLQQPPPVYTENPEDDRPAFTDRERGPYIAQIQSQPDQPSPQTAVPGSGHRNSDHISVSNSNDERRWTRPRKPDEESGFLERFAPEQYVPQDPEPPEPPACASFKLFLDLTIRIVALLSALPAGILCVRAVRDSPRVREPALLGVFGVVFAAGVDLWRIMRYHKDIHKKRYPFLIGLPADIAALALVVSGTFYLRDRVDALGIGGTPSSATMASTVNFAPRALLFLITIIAVIQRLCGGE